MIMRDDVLQCDSKTMWRTDFYYLLTTPSLQIAIHQHVGNLI
jgi:hypothetical protein